MPLSIIRNDITVMEVDAVVNAANPELVKGEGVCYDIFTAAGEQEMQRSCSEFGIQEVGAAVLTPGFALPASYVIHAVGPIWEGGNYQEEEKLSKCYRNVLDTALKYTIESIAFPLISTGSLGFPKDKALHIAVSTITSFLLEHEMTVYLVVYDETSFIISRKLYFDIKSFIDSHRVKPPAPARRRQTSFSVDTPASYEPPGDYEFNPELALQNLEKPFSRKLFELIAEKGLDEVLVYKRANIDRKLFSKIRSSDTYQPAKNTVLSLAVALELDLQEAKDLLGRAGYTLSPSRTFDAVIQYFIINKRYNIHEINEALFSFNQPLLGV